MMEWGGGWKDNIEVKVLVLNTANSDSVSGTLDE